MMETSEQLLQQFKSGDEQAFKRVFEQYRDKVYMKAVYMLGDPDAAEDIVQEVFITLLEKRKSINSCIEYYLLACTRNRCLNEIRKMKKQRTTSEQYNYIRETTALFDPLEGAELAQQLSTAIRGLGMPAGQRVFELSYIGEKSHKQIAEMMNITTGTVKQQLNKVKKKLRERLKFVK